MAATISVDLNARIAKFETEIKKAIGTLDRFGNKSKGIGDSIGRNIGVGLAAAAVGFTALAKSTLDAADNLNDMSTRLGVSVKDLASFKLIAEQSGSSLENVGAGIAKLTKSIGEAEDGNKSMSKALQELSITARDPKEAFFQLADSVVRIQDPAKRAALLSAVLGKSYADLIPVLAEGGEGLRKAAQESESFADSMARLAPNADKFNDNIAKLKLNVSGFAANLLNDLVPALNSTAEYFTKTGSAGKAAEVDLSGIAKLFKFIAFGAVASAAAINEVGIELAYSKERAKALGDLDIAGMKRLTADQKAGFAERVRNLDAYRKELFDLNTEPTPAHSQKKKDVGTINLPDSNSSKKGSASKSDPQGDFVKKLKEEVDALGLSGEALLQYQAKKLNLSGTNKQLADGFIQQITAFKYQEESMKSVTKLFDEQDAAIDNSVVSLKDWIKEQTFEASLIGLTSSQREAAIQLRNLETAGIYKESEAYKTLKQELADASDVNALTRLTQDVNFTKLKQDQADMILLAKAFTDGIKNANGELVKLSEEEYLDAVTNRLGLVKENIAEMDEFAKNAIKSIQSSFADFLFDPFKEGLHGMLEGFGQMLQRMIAEAVAADIMKRLFGELAGGKGDGAIIDLVGGIAEFFKFADGGIMTSKGSVPLNKYAGGGVANSPQLALFGEGRMNEAFIPLPDGRSVPVTMMGGGSNKTNITVVVQGGQSAPDVRRAAAQGAREALGLMSTSQRYA